MKSIPSDAQSLNDAVFSGDLTQRNRAFRSLYMSPKVNAKVRDWARFYNLRDKEPDDILQEAMMLLNDAIMNQRFRGESQVETFFLGICKNLIRDSVKKVRHVFFKDSITDADMASVDDLADHITFDSPQEHEEMRYQELNKVMRQLTDKCQEALKKYYYENKTMDVIAEESNLANREQAKKAVHRCRESLRNLITSNPLFVNA